MTTWWVHPVGESDLMLDSDFHRRRAKDSGLSAEDRRKEIEDKRCEDIEKSLGILQNLTDTGDHARLGELVLEGAWGKVPGRSHTMRGEDLGNQENSGTIPPIAAVLSALAEDSSNRPGPVNLVLLGTQQVPAQPLDTSRIARVLERALRKCAPFRFPVLGSIRTVAVEGMGESNVLAALRPVLSECDPPRDTGIVTVGTGSTALFLGAATGIVESGLPLYFAQVPRGGSVSLLDSMDRHEGDVDPVVAQLIRWRQFRGLLAEAEKAPAPEPLLSPEQTEVVRKLARIQTAGYRAEDAESLRMLVADAIVRRDGTAGLAVRRYAESKYEELLEQEMLSRRASGAPEPENLFTWGRNLKESRKKKGKIYKNPGRNTLGVILGEVKSAEETGEFPHNVGLESTSWLTSSEVDALNGIGIASSHDLAAPSPVLVEKIRGELSPRQDGTGSCPESQLPDPDGLGEVGLPLAPRTPRTGATLIYLVGKPRPDDDRPSVGSQLLKANLGKSVVAHLDLDGGSRTGKSHPVGLTVLLFHTTETEQEARKQYDELKRTKSDSVSLLKICLCDLPSQEKSSTGTGDQDSDISSSLRKRIHEHLDRKLTEGTGAVVLIPVGNKQFLLPLIQILRRVTTGRGLPLFLQEMPNGCTGNHLWPALTGGNHPLLVAARHSIESLELDVAWRLLAACGGCSDLENRCRRLIGAFVCRSIDELGLWPAIGDGQMSEQQCRKETKNPITDTMLPPHTLSLAATRIQLIGEALSAVGRDGSPDHVIAQKIRCLVLAAAVVEKSVAMASPELQGQDAKKRYNNWLCEISAKSDDPRKADAATVLKMLNRSRNQTPITHGTFADPDTLVHDIAKKLLPPVQEPGPLTGGITDVATLLEAAVQAAGILWPDRDPTVPDLPTYWHELLQDLKKEIEEIEKGA